MSDHAQRLYEANVKAKKYQARTRCKCKGEWGRTKKPDRHCPECYGEGMLRTYHPFCNDCAAMPPYQRGLRWSPEERRWVLCQCQREKFDEMMRKKNKSRSEKARSKAERAADINRRRTIDAVEFMLLVRAEQEGER